MMRAQAGCGSGANRTLMWPAGAAAMSVREVGAVRAERGGGGGGVGGGRGSEVRCVMLLSSPGPVVVLPVGGGGRVGRRR